jgi:hypothetical protein
LMKALIAQGLKSILLLSMLLLSGCVFMLLFGPTKFQEPPVSRQTPHKSNNYTAYAMRGLLDVFSTGMDSLAKRLETVLMIQATSLASTETIPLSKHIIHNYQMGYRNEIVLIGHSYGADDQIILAKLLQPYGISVALLITLDTTKKQTIPANVKNYYNLSSGKSIFNILVPWGVFADAESKQTKMHNIDLLHDKGFVRVNHFNIDKLPEVQDYVIAIIKANLRTG